MNLKFWKRDREDDRHEPSRSASREVDIDGPFGEATGRTGSFGNMGGGGSDRPLHDSSGTPSSSNGRIGESDRGRH